VLVTALGAAAPPPAREPGTLAYTVTLTPSGDAALDTALAALSQLTALREKAPTGGLGLLGRALGDERRLPEALRAEGYYGGTLRIEIAGLPLTDPALPARLQAAERAPEPVPVTVTASPGRQYRITRIDLVPVNPAEQAALEQVAAKPFGVAPGDPARAAPVLAAEATLRQRLRSAGHPFAAITGREVVVDFDHQSMAILWHIAPGPTAVFAAPQVGGTETVGNAFLERRASRLAGQPFSPERLEQARRDLMSLGTFASVRAEPGATLDADGRLPVRFVVADRPRHAVGVNLAYETNYGPSIRVFWEDRNVFGNAERLRLEAEISRLLVNGGLDQATYRIGGTFRDPDPLRGRLGPDWSTVSSAYAVRELLKAYDRQAITVLPLLERRFSDRFSMTAGPLFDVGQTGAPGSPQSTWQNYEIIGLQLGGKLDTTDSLLDPARGYRLLGSLMPAYSIRDQTPFAPFKLTGTTYWDALGDKRGILALRTSLGALPGADLENVPRHMRFYAGGGGSVRGYGYQTIGPRDAQGQLTGGASLMEASAEWRQRVWGDFGMVAFLDTGAVGSRAIPGSGDWRAGAGLGVRYYTSIGPVRADFAVPLVSQTGQQGYGLYVGVGQAF
jgi:translocation and assembly module TamA